MFTPFVFWAIRLIFRYNLINLLVSSDIKKSISFTSLFGQDLSNAVLIMLAILFTVASISAVVTASVSIKFLSIILRSYTQSVFSCCRVSRWFYLTIFDEFITKWTGCGRCLHLGLLYMYLPLSRYCDWQYIDLKYLWKYLCSVLRFHHLRLLNWAPLV